MEAAPCPHSAVWSWLILEAHSTDYQGELVLTALVEDGFAILKVGPELTFVLREALYALDLIASDLPPDYGDRPLHKAMAVLVVDRAENWSRHSCGTMAEQRVLRHYSLSDPIRYYWPAPEAQGAAEWLMAALAGRRVPRSLIWQHLSGTNQFAEFQLGPATGTDLAGRKESFELSPRLPGLSSAPSHTRGETEWLKACMARSPSSPARRLESGLPPPRR